MVKNRNKLICLIIAFTCLLSLPVYGTDIVPYASDQLGAYEVDAVATGGGEIAIEFSVEGTGVMKSIGAEKIRVFEDYGSDGWVLVGSFSKNNSGMTASNKNVYGNTKYFYGNEGSYYKVEVTIFATNAQGTDSRTLTRYVTA